MPRIDRVRFGRVVLQVDLRQSLLRCRQDLELILEVVLGCLVDDQIQVQFANSLGGNLAHVVRQIERGATATVALGSLWFYWQEPVVVDAR